MEIVLETDVPIDILIKKTKLKNQIKEVKEIGHNEYSITLAYSSSRDFLTDADSRGLFKEYLGKSITDVLLNDLDSNVSLKDSAEHVDEFIDKEILSNLFSHTVKDLSEFGEKFPDESRTSVPRISDTTAKKFLSSVGMNEDSIIMLDTSRNRTKLVTNKNELLKAVSLGYHKLYVSYDLINEHIDVLDNLPNFGTKKAYLEKFITTQSA